MPGGITFTVDSGLQNSIFGIVQAPIRRFIEKRAEAFEAESLLPKLFLMDTSKNHMDALTSMTAMDSFKPVGENGAYPSTSMQQSFEKVFKYQTWKQSFSISREAVDDSKIMDLKRQPTAFTTAYYRGRELFGISAYAHAIELKKSFEFEGGDFDITSVDGVSVFNTQHPAKVKKDLKQSNCFKDAFSVDALTRAEVAMHHFKGDNGELLKIAPDTILIPDDPDLMTAVFAAIGADKQPTTGNNDFNFQYGRWTVIISSYLSELAPKATTAPWILLDSKYNGTYGGALWTDRVKLEVTSEKDSNDANKWKGYARYSCTFNDWRFACVGGVSAGTELKKSA